MSGGLLGSFLSDGGIGKGAVSMHHTGCVRPRSSELHTKGVPGAPSSTGDAAAGTDNAYTG